MGLFWFYNIGCGFSKLTQINLAYCFPFYLNWFFKILFFKVELIENLNL